MAGAPRRRNTPAVGTSAWVTGAGGGGGRAGGAFALGILLFSGSLYLLTLSGVGKLGIVTPFGGVAFLVGWVALVVAAARG